jgi:DNA (cytosine-5)-methyltransferase 1
MSAAWFSEIEKFPSAVLAHHWPHVANLGDMTTLPYLVSSGLVEAPPILVGGTPCQAFSIAGLRKGLEDERGLLTMRYVELADAVDKQRGEGDECVIVWENVPGVLSSVDNAFGCFLGALAGADCAAEPGEKPENGKNNKYWRWNAKSNTHVAKWSNAGYLSGPKRTIAWRVLDAQYFGVAQRRRRVFVVASARDGFDPAEVLFEREGVRRDTPPSRETREEAARGAGGGTVVYRWQNEATGVVEDEICSTLLAGGWKTDERNVGALVCHAISGAVICRKEGNGPQGPGIYEEYAPTLTSSDKHAVSVAFRYQAGAKAGSTGLMENCSPTLTSDEKAPGVLREGAVRRLTPTECERLQGFPDNHTLIPWRGKAVEDCPDGPRYKAIGNSKAVPVIQWVGLRVALELLK